MTGMHEIEARIRQTAEGLLREKKVDLFLGYEKASVPLRTSPLFLKEAAEAERLAWNPFCSLNLAAYLPALFQPSPGGKQQKPPPTVGVALKGCDSRAVVALIQERQLPREKLVLVGIACPGVVDARKAERALGEHEALGAGEDPQGNIRVVVEDGSEVTLRREEVLSDACQECRCPTPSVHDVLLGAPAQGKDPGVARQRAAEFESKPADTRWARFQEMVSRCIRCNACRQACPMCYCRDCLLDQTRTRWLGPCMNTSDLAVYHLIRAFHMAGRCVECGACARACPMGIDARLLVRKLNLDVEDLYGYRAGEATDAVPPLSAFAADDPQEFLTEPSPAVPAGETMDPGRRSR
jgi:ferredoxin